MLKNYFYLNRFVVEAASHLANSRLVEAFSQEKDKLILNFSEGDKNQFLEINTNPGFPFINLRESYHRAKKNTINFFSKFLPSSFLTMSIAESDRIINISLTNADIYFAIRGKFTNVVLFYNNGKSEIFKNYDSEYLNTFSDEIKQLNFTDLLNFPEIITGEDPDFFDNVRANYPFLGKEIFSEYKLRFKPGINQSSLLTQIINEALISKPEVIINKNSFEIWLQPSEFHKDVFSEAKQFGSVAEAFNYFIHSSYYLDEYRNKLKLIEKFLARELNRLSLKLNNLKAQADKDSREEEYNKAGNLLLINLAEIEKGKTEIILKDIYSDNKEMKIMLDPKLSPEQNAKKYFDKARSEKINIQKSQLLLQQYEKKYNELIQIKNKLVSDLSIKDLSVIMKQLKIKEPVQKEKKSDVTFRFRHYIIEDKHHVYVGRDSRNNDELTLKFAKQNDYWFHARSVSGSHVVLRVENTKEGIPKSVLKKAASLAAYHSKAKTAGVVPVSYTLKKYVVKKKGMAPGKVALMKEEVLLVEPLIPADCIFVEDD